MKKNAFQSFAAVPHSVWVVMFIVAPLLFVLAFAFRGADGSFSFANIAELTQYGNVFVLSIAFALIATVICLLIGYPLAYFMSRQSARAQRILLVLVMLPMWCNLLIRTYALMALLDNGGLLNAFLESIGLEKLYIVGGGAKNGFLNRLTEEATGKTVLALPIEATALGNLKIQMEADR